MISTDLPSPESEGLRGFIQAGGRSQRMGSDKAWMLVSERPMIEHVLRAARPLCKNVSIVISQDHEQRNLYENFAPMHNALLLVDERNHCGPLGGIEASLKECAPDESALILACDLPFVTTEFLQQLWQIHHQANSLLTIPLDQQAQMQMLAGIYLPQCLDAVQTMLHWGEFKTDRLCLRVRTHLVSFREYAHLPHAEKLLHNINTPDELPQRA